MCIVLLSGCSMHNKYLVHFRSKEPFYPQDGSELILELRNSLPSDVTPKQFYFNKRKDGMGGAVLVDGENAKEAVKMAIRTNSMLAGGLTEKACAGGKFIIWFSSCLPFNPSDEDELLTELKQHLDSSIHPKLIKSEKSSDSMSAWVIVKGNLGKTAVKSAVGQNPNLSPALQVESWNLTMRTGICLRRIKEFFKSE